MTIIADESLLVDDYEKLGTVDQVPCFQCSLIEEVMFMPVKCTAVDSLVSYGSNWAQ